jgi:simple sugar transport system permease protein
MGGTRLRGGVGSVFGTVVGVLLIGVIFNVAMTREGLSSGLTRVLIGALLLASVLLQRFLGRGSRKD